MRSIKLLIIFSAMLFLTTLSSAADFSIESQVDRAEVGFGESFNLVVTITQNLSSGRTNRLSMPSINSIPGFDIASTRSGQSTSFINGVGVSRSQIVYELVPQQSGKATIPAFSFTDAEGNQHSSNPIEINVLAPEDKPAENQPGQPASPDRPSGTNFFKMVLAAGIILGLIVAIPFLWHNFSGKSEQLSGFTQPASEDKPSSKSVSPGIEDAQIISGGIFDKGVAVRIDFPSEIARLKKEYPETGIEFYTKYFEIFRSALAGNSSIASSDQTIDEIFARICSQFPRNDIADACRRIASDLELVMYANRAPTRQFSGIDDDAREILTVISD